MFPDPEDSVSVDVHMPAALFADLDAYAVAHDYASVDEAVREAIDRHVD